MNISKCELLVLPEDNIGYGVRMSLILITSRGNRFLAGQCEPSPAETEMRLIYLSLFLPCHPLGMSSVIIKQDLLSETAVALLEAEFRCFPRKALPVHRAGFAGSLLGRVETLGLHCPLGSPISHPDPL